MIARLRQILWLSAAGLIPGTQVVAGDSIAADFSSRTFDQWLFRTDSRDTGGRWDLEGPALRAILPPGKVGRPAIKLVGQFRLEGDFEVVASFAIRKLPRPARPSGNNGAELAIWGPGRYASVFRQAQAAADGRGYFIHRDESGKDVAGFLPSPEKSGRLGVRRVGDRLSFLYGKASGPLAEIGSAPFGNEPVDGLVLQGSANNTADELDLQFGRLDVIADRVVRLHGPPARSTNGWAVVGGAGSVIAIGFLAIWIYRSSSHRQRG